MTCTIETTFCKGVNEVLDYVVKWGTWLGADTIATSTFTADTGITIDSDTNDTTDATVWLSGGTRGAEYKIVNSITTGAGRTAERTFFISMVER